ncbi:MAG TPA: A24 family peptidase [Streptosporangiaceae bacterium]|nr:A24 family peptidase [Streptosporangiaceae bacterium]
MLDGPVRHSMDAGVRGDGMDVMWAATSAAAGLVAGLALRGEVVRLSVRGGEPDEAACAACAAPLPRRLAFLCGNCGRWFGPPLAIEITSAAVIALLLAKFGGQPAVAAFAYLGVIGVALSQIDLAVQRLPDRLTLPAYPALVTLLTVAAAVGDDWAALIRAVLAGLALGGGYLVLSLVSGGQVGGGDVKLAGLAGLVLGWLSWDTLIIGAFAGFLLAALVSAGLLAARKITKQSRLSFGPYLLGGALLATLATSAVPR